MSAADDYHPWLAVDLGSNVIVDKIRVMPRGLLSVLHRTRNMQVILKIRFLQFNSHFQNFGMRKIAYEIRNIWPV